MPPEPSGYRHGAIPSCNITIWQNSGLNPVCKHNKLITPPTHRRVCAGKGCRRQDRTARHRRRTVPSLHGVAVSSQLNRTGHRLTGTHISLLSRHGRGTPAGRGPASRSRRNRTPNGPGYSPPVTIPPIRRNETPEAIRRSPPAFPGFPRAASLPPGQAARRPRRARNPSSARSADHGTISA